MLKQDLRIVFMGTPDYAKGSLEALVDNAFNIVGVFCQPDKPKGRGMKLMAPPVKEYAISKGIPVYQPVKLRNNEEVKEILNTLNPDLIVVVAYGKILPKYVLDFPRFGCINVHGSLLPNYRGAAPIQWSVINGDKVTGITTMFMDVGMDTGDIILKEETEIGAEETAGELFDRLAVMGSKTLEKTIKLFETGNVPRQKQPEGATYASMLNKEIANIDFSKTTEEIISLVKGLNPWPVAYTVLNGIKLKVYSAKISEYKGTPGEIIKSDCKEGLIIGTKNGAVELVEIQPENKKRMTAKSYLVGNKI